MSASLLSGAASCSLRRVLSVSSSAVPAVAALRSRTFVSLSPSTSPLRRAAMRAPFTRAPLGSRSLFVGVESTPNPDSMKFVPEGRGVLPEDMGSGMHFSSIEEAKGSKLVRRLMKIEQVTGVFLGKDFISVNKREDTQWAPLKPIILDAIMDAFNELDTKGTPLVEKKTAPSPDTAVQPEDDEVVALIKELLETRIRPAVQEDGGDIFYEGFDQDTGIVKLRMAGSCVGCPSSTATLRNGVENMLMHYIPEVRGIEQVVTEAEQAGKKQLDALEKELASKQAAEEAAEAGAKH